MVFCNYRKGFSYVLDAMRSIKKTVGWIFGGDETEKWEETLSKIKAGDGEEKGTLVGAQWNTKDATADVPNVFDEKVRYRPIFYCGVWA